MRDRLLRVPKLPRHQTSTPAAHPVQRHPAQARKNFNQLCSGPKCERCLVTSVQRVRCARRRRVCGGLARAAPPNHASTPRVWCASPSGAAGSTHGRVSPHESANRGTPPKEHTVSTNSRVPLALQSSPRPARLWWVPVLLSPCGGGGGRRSSVVVRARVGCVELRAAELSRSSTSRTL